MLGATLLATLFLAQNATPPNLVVVTGNAEKVFPADAATIDVGASATDVDRTTAVSTADAVLVRAIAASRAIVADPKSYEAAKGSVMAELEQGFGSGGLGSGAVAKEPSVKDYVAGSYVRVHVTQVDHVDPLLRSIGKIDGATANLAEYGLKDESAARRAVLKAAFLDAKSKAEEAADAAGLKLGGVYLLDIGAGATVTPNFETNGLTVQQGGYRAVPAKSVTARAALTVRFYIG